MIEPLSQEDPGAGDVAAQDRELPFPPVDNLDLASQEVFEAVQAVELSQTGFVTFTLSPELACHALYLLARVQDRSESAGARTKELLGQVEQSFYDALSNEAVTQLLQWIDDPAISTFANSVIERFLGEKKLLSTAYVSEVLHPIILNPDESTKKRIIALQLLTHNMISLEGSEAENYLNDEELDLLYGEIKGSAKLNFTDKQKFASLIGLHDPGDELVTRICDDLNNSVSNSLWDTACSIGNFIFRKPDTRYETKLETAHLALLALANSSHHCTADTLFIIKQTVRIAQKLREVFDQVYASVEDCNDTLRMRSDYSPS